ncbi:DUF262 domain-containing protein [Pedobacter sp. FW305-3-2-15-E-R2A2]|uniref:DUF262 domain-containing protein n=1 Tax=Pedobacter sp. FW305-3-2-15-E-R2A2 TaxID=3140251 RepID=UPI0031409968
MSNQLVFPIKHIFSTDSPDSALYQHKAARYYIAPYQRGYKWSADMPNGAVSVLIRDLIEAYQARSSEYYLQYITIKKNTVQEHPVLEVIDGQQRLTTLTLLSSVLEHYNPQENPSIAKHRLLYEVRDKVTDFFNRFIYENIGELLKLDWENFVKEHISYDEQDIYFLFHAIKRLDTELRSAGLNEPDPAINFCKYLHEAVMLILNNVEGNVSCEKIFSNLNTNKIELTNVELIKGLFLTKAARKQHSTKEISYAEIVKKRTLLGRQWDELILWALSPDARALYFNKEENPVYKLLQMLGARHQFLPLNSGNDKYALFNFFQSRIKTEKSSAGELFDELKKIQYILQNWLSDPNIYNLIGYILSAKGTPHTLNNLLPLLESPMEELRKELSNLALALIPNDIQELDYRENESQIHSLLLALSIFQSKNRFDFASFSAQNWSLEHIFPQNPAELPDGLDSADISLLNSLLENRLEDESALQEKFGEIKLTKLNSLRTKMQKNTCTLDDEEKELLFKVIRSEKLNTIGNMALLTSSDNSSNSNGMFGKKRHNIVGRISKGSFVPKHTYDVFSKLLSNKMTSDLSVWTENDMSAHQTWIMDKITNLTKEGIK